jgi:putative membrane protein
LNKRTKTNWRRKGQAPDYRFSLANERTYLSWIRTSLALLAGAVGIEHLVPELEDSSFRFPVTILLCTLAAVMPLFAYRRWASNELAMRTGQTLTYSKAIKIISLVIFIVVLLVIAMLWQPLGL